MKSNPFEFEAAIRFTAEEMVDYFIEDNNFARFVNSQRNVFLLGDRGTGKTMMLRFYSLVVQMCKHKRDPNPRDLAERLKLVGVYIPCRNIALAKLEPELLDPLLGRIVSEHLMVVAVINSLAEALCSVPGLVTDSEADLIREEIQFVFQWELQKRVPVFEALKRAAIRESAEVQRVLNARTPDSSYDNAITFSSAVLPLIELLTTNVAKLTDSHFSFMFDDAEALTNLQNETLNTWIASRNTSKVSYKVSTSLVDQKPLLTSTGGELLERHDFIRVDMEQDFQNTEASYHKLAKDIIERRLEKIKIQKSAEDFFPINEQMASDLEAAAEKARSDAVAKFPNGTPKQIRDYVYKYSRAYYFRSRNPRANRPPYSGFNLIVHVSTGVLRYLLEPCYEMYDSALSRSKTNGKELIDKIDPSIQTDRLEDLSQRRWDWIKEGFNNSIRGSTRDDAQHLAQLLDHLAVLLNHRLHFHKSEPRAITFSMAALDKLDKDKADKLFHLLEVARRAQILFRRTASAKDEGRREHYYTFDRLLWIVRGLDPVGQNACVSLEAQYLWEAAFENKAFPTSPKEKSVRKEKASESASDQPEMFDFDEL